MPDHLWTPQGDVPIRKSWPSPMRATAAGRASGVEATTESGSDVAREMRRNRMAKQANAGMGGQVNFATQRSHDPMFYWKQSNIPYDYEKETELLKLRRYAKLIYLTHPVIAACIDVYSQWPLTGLHFECKDPEIQDFYSELFLNDLNYEEYLPHVAQSYWAEGEAFPMGQFNDLLGIWEDDELINPEDVNVIESPFLKEPRFEMRVPAEIRKIISERSPEWEYRQLIRAYPEMVRFAQTEEFMPVSNVLMKHLAFKPDKFFHRGIPIIMRAFRYIYQEEMLNAALDSLASRMYTPLILVRLGASASDMGTDVAWVPTSDDLQNFEMALDTALAADFRVLTSHFATQVDQVFGKEAMPNFTEDFDRLMDRQLLCFGLSRTLLMGASSGETYAADALNRDLVSTLLTRLQRMMARFVRSRMEVVAEAQGHYDYELRGGKPYPIMEEKLIIEDDGSKRIVESPRLLVPDVKFNVLNLTDEQSRRGFIEQLRQTGVPISDRTRLVNLNIDLEDEYEVIRDEQVRLAVETQETRKETYLELLKAGLPIPQDLKDDFEAKVINADDVEQAQMTEDPMAQQMAQQMAEQGVPLPNEMLQPSPDAAYLPNPEDEALASPDAPAGTPPQADLLQGLMMGLSTRPPESDEQRKNMPKPPTTAPMKSAGIRPTAARESVTLNGEEVHEGVHSLISGPSLRQRPEVDPALPWDEQPL